MKELELGIKKADIKDDPKTKKNEAYTLRKKKK